MYSKSDPVKTGKYISLLRKKRDMTQFALAAELRVSHQAVSKWETGSALPDIDTLLELANLFEVSIDNLISGSDNEIETIAYTIKTSQDIPLLLNEYEEMRGEIIADCIKILGIHDSAFLFKLCSGLSARKLMQIIKTIRLYEIISLVASQMDRNDIIECMQKLEISDKIN